MKISLWSRLLDVVSPRRCAVCSTRLSITECDICATCNMHLPRTGYQTSPYDNVMAKLFWGQIPIERAAALFYYEAHSETSRIIYGLKYRGHPEIGVSMGRMAAGEFMTAGFFDGIDMIIPLPLARKRMRERGYNQSEAVAKGVSEIAGIPINTRVVKRMRFNGSQTSLSRWGRLDNVENMFKLIDGNGIEGKHILLVDDIVTTGATIIACAKTMVQVKGLKLSVMTLGFTKS